MTGFKHLLPPIIKEIIFVILDLIDLNNYHFFKCPWVLISSGKPLMTAIILIQFDTVETFLL